MPHINDDDRSSNHFELEEVFESTFSDPLVSLHPLVDFSLSDDEIDKLAIRLREENRHNPSALHDAIALRLSVGDRLERIRATEDRRRNRCEQLEREIAEAESDGDAELADSLRVVLASARAIVAAKERELRQQAQRIDFFRRLWDALGRDST